ncbi:hypothetical protein L486_01438 [Kwoniella mangroviensis CBS 10435]|uniref:Uncharacterized protein n=1 Tax=Kwoniella mangroviensis CBS 10435 TaxID=1331196 RepID=A0A1B9J1W1_9TREE|nr:hypothetical protein L486_01438 [Kwoniella mangroviensis CBS 10435]
MNIADFVPRSEADIQDHLRVLYNTSVSHPVQNGPRHLINHQMNIHMTSVQSVTRKAETDQLLQGYIRCPEITFGKTDDDGNQIVRIKYHFRHAQEGEVTPEQMKGGRRLNSVLFYKDQYISDEQGPMLERYNEINIDGWEISWEACLNAQNLKDMYDEIMKLFILSIEDSTTCITEKVERKKPISKTSNLNNDVRLIHTFTVLDDEGKKPHNLHSIHGDEIKIDHLILSMSYTLYHHLY